MFKENIECHITENIELEKKLERREVDSCMVVTEAKRDNTVTVKKTF